MMARSPASPPVPPSGWNAAACEPSSLNLNDGMTKCTAPAPCGVANRDIPAGFAQMVLTSSADAAPPANALPSPLPEFSCSANAAPKAWPAASRTPSPPIAVATRVRLNVIACIGVSPPQLRRMDALRRLCPVPARRPALADGACDPTIHVGGRQTGALAQAIGTNARRFVARPTQPRPTGTGV